MGYPMPIAILLGTITTMTVWILYMILTPLWSGYSNSLGTFASRENLTAELSNLTTLNIQWGVVFFISFLFGGIVVYLSAYRQEPDEFGSQF